MIERRQYPYGMSAEQQLMFSTLTGHFRQLGYAVRSEPLEGGEQDWLDGLADKLERIEERLRDINKGFRTRGRSKMALYFLHTDRLFDPGFGLDASADQKAAIERTKSTPRCSTKFVLPWQRYGERGDGPSMGRSVCRD